MSNYIVRTRCTTESSVWDLGLSPFDLNMQSLHLCPTCPNDKFKKTHGNNIKRSTNVWMYHI